VWKYSLNGIAELFRHQKNGYMGSQDVSQKWTWSGSQAYHKNTHRFTDTSEEHTQVHRLIIRTHTGSQAYHKNTHRFTGLSQEHTQVHRHITRTYTGSQAYHKNTHRFTDISQEHTQFHRHIIRTHAGSQTYHKNTHRFTDMSQGWTHCRFTQRPCIKQDDDSSIRVHTESKGQSH